MMLDDIADSKSDENLLLLNYSARLLTTFTSREDLLNIAVECLADCANCEWVGILTLSPNDERLCFESVFSSKSSIPANGEIALDSSPLAEVVLSKRVADCMLYRGKQAGRNRIEVWTDDEASEPGQAASAAPRAGIA